MSVTQSARPASSYHVFSNDGGPTAITVRGAIVRAFALVAAFFALLIVSTLLIALSPTLSRSVTAFFIHTQTGATPWNGSDPVNMVLVGLDEDAARAQTFPHTDTMLVLSVNPASDSVKMLSIPRDTWVNIPGYGPDRINDAYGDGGPKLLIKTAEAVTQMPIRYYAIISFTGFQKVIDAAGGVTIDVQHAINDPTYPAPTGFGYAPLHIRAGVQHMNGKLALEYVRTRHNDPLGDLGRNQRQQQVLEALKSQMLSPLMVVRLPGFLQALGQAVKTNFPYSDLTYLARVIVTAPKSHQQRSALNYADNAVSNYTTPGGAEVLLPNWPRIHALTRAMFRDPRLATSSIEVLNGTGTSGQAAAMSTWLQACGFRVGSIGNAASINFGHTEVIRNTAASGNNYVARMASDLLQTPLLSRSMPGTSAPVVVIVGADWNNPLQS
ncbi:MAG TPA: LCP family protein [Chloroflexota bacterium]|nr:LCP family protein [Chloroflexota bacterium]